MAHITKVEARTVRIPLRSAVSFSTRKVDARHYTLVRVSCSDDSYGIGFCHGGTKYGGLATDAVRHMLAAGLISEDPHRTEGLWQELHQETLLNGRTGAVMRALSALDTALWDRNARSVGLPLWRFLGAYHKETVPAYASGGYYAKGDGTQSPADLVAAEVEGYVKAGFKAVKIKIGGLAPSVEEARVAAARQVLGPNGILLLDANNAWKDLPSALRYVEPLLQYRPFLIEEPFGPDDLDNHARLAAALPVSIATGEIVGGRWGHRELIERGRVTVLQPDAMVCGGITEFRRVAATAASFGVAVAPHSVHHLHAHLVASTPNALFAEYFADDSIVPFRQLADQQFELRNGELVLPTEPGLGFDFETKAVERYAVDGWS